MKYTQDVPEGWTPEQEADWQALCDDVDTDLYVRDYVEAGGQRTFEQWRERPLSPRERDCLSGRHAGTFAELTEPFPFVLDTWVPAHLPFDRDRFRP